ncbi:hypothetical protein [Flavobacterium sp. GCM10023249]|uniref:hypothetical protein n=1 Tax=unclassified Flavobacterium TaxID=196869 RepID=UPI00360CCE96
MKNHNNTIATSVFNIANTLLNAYTSEPQQAAIDAKKAEFIKENPTILSAVYPCIVDEAFAITMDNYRKYIAKYNTQTSEENAAIELWNSTINKTQERNEVENTFITLFYKNYSHLNSRDYNQKVEEFYNDRTIQLEKVKIQPVKYATELLFSAILSAYNAQLINQNSEYMKLLVAVERPISPMKLNSWFITQMKRNGVQALDLCSKTVRNHRDRLFEAGVLTGRCFKGSKSAIECHVNPEILTVLDFQNNQMRKFENQSINPEEGKILPDNDVSTRAIKDKKEKKENGTTDFLKEGSSGKALTITYFSTGTPVRNQAKKTEGAAVGANFSENLLRTLEDEQILAEKLAENQFIEYKSIDIRYLTHEAYNGTLTNEEFVQVVVQDFFKSSNKLWKNNTTAYPGSWKLALNQYLKSKFRLFNGNPMQKVNILDDIQELRWRLEFARKWFLQNPNMQILYPNNYFDFSRTKSYEMGFEYTKEKYKNHLKKIEKQGQVRAKAEAKAKRRALSYKYNTKVNQFLNNKIDYDQLKKYVQNNLPKEFQENLSIHINKLLNERNQLQLKQQLEQKYNNVQYNLNDFNC